MTTTITIPSPPPTASPAITGAAVLVILPPDSAGPAAASALTEATELAGGKPVVVAVPVQSVPGFTTDAALIAGNRRRRAAEANARVNSLLAARGVQPQAHMVVVPLPARRTRRDQRKRMEALIAAHGVELVVTATPKLATLTPPEWLRTFA